MVEEERAMLESWNDGKSDEFDQEVAVLIRLLRNLYFETSDCVVAEVWDRAQHIAHKKKITVFMDTWQRKIHEYQTYMQVCTDRQQVQWNRVVHLFKGLLSQAKDMNQRTYTKQVTM